MKSVFIVFAGAVGASAKVDATPFCWGTFRENVVKEMMLQVGVNQGLEFFPNHAIEIVGSMD